MLRKALNLIVLLPLAIIFIVFAVANRHFVTVSFDPFDAANSALTLSLPLFVIIILSAMAGVIAGSAATWFGQRHWRRRVRKYEADAARARRDMVYREAGNYAPAVPGAMINPPI